MSTTAQQRITSIPDFEGVKFTGVLLSELVKLFSLRSSVGLLLSILVFGIGTSVGLGVLTDSVLPSVPSIGFMLDEVTVGTVLFGQLAAGVLGALVITGEYSSGTMLTTLVAVPSRGRVLIAKAVVLFLAVTATALVSIFGSWAATYPMFASHGLEVGLGAPGVLGAFLGAAVYVGLASVLGLGVGALLRSVAAGVSAIISVILLLPIVLSVLPLSPFVRSLHMLTMSKAGDAMAGVASTEGGFMDLADGYVSPVAGLVIAVVWSVAFLAFGAARLCRKDA